MTVTPEVVFAAVGFLLIPGLRPTNRAANTDGLLESLSQSFTSDSDRPLLGGEVVRRRSGWLGRNGCYLVSSLFNYQKIRKGAGS